MSHAPPRRYPWASRFAELALRAVRRVHYNYGALHIGEQWRDDSKPLSQINQGVGIASADELSVCAAIAQECILSQGFSGSWVTPDPNNSMVKPGKRLWSLDREQQFSDGSKRVDFVVKRVPDPQISAEANHKWKPCFIEAKRVRRWTTKSLSSPDFKPADPILNEIRKDICKLRKEMSDRKEDRIFSHLLLWNIWEVKADGPTEVLKDLGDQDVYLHQVRWMPISWSHTLEAREVVPHSDPPTMKTWFWLGLFEVDEQP